MDKEKEIEIMRKEIGDMRDDIAFLKSQTSSHYIWLNILESKIKGIKEENKEDDSNHTGTIQK